MTLNTGWLDRAVRVALGLVLVSMVFLGPKTWLGWFGLVFLATGFVGFCPVYRFLGIHTSKPA